MAMEPAASALPNNVQPVQSPQAAGQVGIVSRRDGGDSSAFSPQTNVNIQNSVTDMAQILTKLAAQQNEDTTAMPQQIQKLIQNLLQKSFSLDATLANGLGSTMESQRFSVEQLLVLSRILSQMGSLSEQGNMGQLSDGIQSFLQNLKMFVSTGDMSLEPVLIDKTAFQLLNAKSLKDLPMNLQQLLGQAMAGGVMGQQVQGQSEGMAFLKQLIRYFMPASSGFTGTSAAEKGKTPDAANPQGTAAQQESEALLPQNMRQTVRGNTAQNLVWQSSGNNSLPTGNTTQLQEKGQDSAATAKNAGNSTEKGASLPTKEDGNTQVSARTSNALSSNTLSQAATKGSSAGQTLLGQQAQDTETPQQAGKEQGTTGETSPGRAAMAETANSAAKSLSQPTNAAGTNAPLLQNTQELLENTPQMMDVMKDLGALLLKDANLTEQDAQLLQNFVNGKQTTLSEKDAKQLQLLLKLCQNNMPAVVQQAAKQQNMPDLPKIWAFMQLCELTSLKEMNARELRTASKDISDFAAAMKHSLAGESNSNVEGQRSMNFMMPLYLGENDKRYPAYIHVYDQKKQAEEQNGSQEKETWLRLCVLTDNIGAVELICRVYEKQKLDMRLVFSNSSVSDSFKEYAPVIKDTLKDSSLILTDLKYGVIGNKL